MSTTIIEIKEKEIEQFSSKVEIVIPYRLNAIDMTAYVHFKADDGFETIKVVPVYISPEEYALWLNTDEYMENLILLKAGVERA
ncbi:MAG: hypothetical protein RLZZ86_1235 [Cyanobacteriota bacterium]